MENHVSRDPPLIIEVAGSAARLPEAQRHGEKQNQDFVALTCEKPFNLRASNTFWFYPAQRETIHGFPAELDCSFGSSLKEDVSASLRENILYGTVKYAHLGPEDQVLKTK